MSITDHATWKALQAHATEVQAAHLRDLMLDGDRCRAMTASHGDIVLDYSRQLATHETMQRLTALADGVGLQERIAAMFRGDRINTSENRSVLHTALRMPDGASLVVDGEDVAAQASEVRRAIATFSERVRGGEFVGVTGKPLTQVVAIGIGGSYLGPEFVAESLRTDPECAKQAAGRQLRFLANVDPIDVTRALEGLDPERTLAIVISKTFTTAETMLNAKTVRAWLTSALGASAPSQHMIAVSTNLEKVAEFGINPSNTFGFWDWVGGRYSVSSAVGLVPLALHYGSGPTEEFLAGAHDIDQHFATAPLLKNLPVLLGLFGVWNSSFLGHSCRALLPYCQSLLKLAPHIQQVDMESNGKRVASDGTPLDFAAGEIDFGEPGTNGQHSFYQLLHQGRVVPADFVGFVKSQQPMKIDGEIVSNHDELMSNFFAQPDALACGRTAEEARAEGIAEALIPHKVFPGNRPSNVLLFPILNPFTTGQILALYEHRTAVQGFIWGINSFDQMGVELGKVLGVKVRKQLIASRKDDDATIEGFNPSTTALIQRYLKG